MAIEDQAFSQSYEFTFPRPPRSSQQVVSLSQPSCVSPVELTDGGGGEGVEEETNHTSTRKPGPL
jgi:hypothetical protein